VEPLLQAHVIAPLVAGERHDDLITLFDDHALRAANDGYLDDDRDGIEVASTLFEDRPDNREMLRELRAAIQELFDDGDVFWSEHEHTFGEHLSTGEPHYHVVFEVANVDNEPSRLRWQTHAETLDAPPRTDGEQVYHADHEGVFALDATTGEHRWHTEVPDNIRAPEIGDDIVVASGGYVVTALDAASGEERWTAEYDYTEKSLIESRVAIGRESVFVGFRDGRVDQLDVDDGAREELAAFDETVTQVTVTDAGLLVAVGRETLAMLATDGTTRWTLDTQIGNFPPVVESDETLYVGTAAGVQSLSGATGTEHWTAEVGSGPCLERFGDRLVVQESGAVTMLDSETGEVDSRVTFGADDPTPEQMISQRSRGDEHVATTDERVLGVDHDGVLHVVDPETATVESTYELTVDCSRPTGLGDDAVCVVGEDVVRLAVD
jgi:outer membrane protein assembly factor BamB